MKLIDAYSDSFATIFLYDLLLERTPEQSISHKEMPTYAYHCEFFNSRPYEHWYLIETEDDEDDECDCYIGSIYLSKNREIGVFILNEEQGNGYGKAAVKLLLELHPGRALWNVNPENERSIAMAKSLGGKLIQHTFEIPA